MNLHVVHIYVYDSTCVVLSMSMNPHVLSYLSLLIYMWVHIYVYVNKKEDIVLSYIINKVMQLSLSTYEPTGEFTSLSTSPSSQPAIHPTNQLISQPFHLYFSRIVTLPTFVFPVSLCQFRFRFRKLPMWISIYYSSQSGASYQVFYRHVILARNKCIFLLWLLLLLLYYPERCLECCFLHGEKCKTNRCSV